MLTSVDTTKEVPKLLDWKYVRNNVGVYCVNSRSNEYVVIIHAADKNDNTPGGLVVKDSDVFILREPINNGWQFNYYTKTNKQISLTFAN